MNCMGWQRQEVVTIDTPSGNPAKKQRKSEEVVQQDSKGNILGTARYKVRGSQESCYSILFTSGCPVRWFRFNVINFFLCNFFLSLCSHGNSAKLWIRNNETTQVWQPLLHRNEIGRPLCPAEWVCHRRNWPSRKDNCLNIEGRREVQQIRSPNNIYFKLMPIILQGSKHLVYLFCCCRSD